jgi:hypothetical protein
VTRRVLVGGPRHGEIIDVPPELTRGAHLPYSAGDDRLDQELYSPMQVSMIEQAPDGSVSRRRTWTVWYARGGDVDGRIATALLGESPDVDVTTGPTSAFGRVL